MKKNRGGTSSWDTIVVLANSSWRNCCGRTRLGTCLFLGEVGGEGDPLSNAMCVSELSMIGHIICIKITIASAVLCG